MNNMLLISQSGEFTGMVKYISIGKRSSVDIIGDKLQKLLDDKKITTEILTKELNVNKNIIRRLLENEEVPSKEMLDKLSKYFSVEIDYFIDTELNNVIITDGNIVIARYDTNEQAMKKKRQLDELIVELFRTNKNIIIDLSKEK